MVKTRLLFLLFALFSCTIIDCETPIKGRYIMQEYNTTILDCSDIATRSQNVEFSRNKTLDTKERFNLNETENFEIENNILTLKNISKDDIAYHYKCENKYTGTSRKFNVHPSIKTLERKEFTITEGVFFEVTCKTIDHEEYINSKHLEWYWDKLDSSDATVYQTLVRNGTDPKFKNTTEGNLYIIRTTADYEGTYRCSVKNDNGVDYELIVLKIRNKLANVLPFVGISVQVIVMCGIILLWEKKCNRNKSTYKYEISGITKQVEEEYKSRQNAPVSLA